MWGESVFGCRDSEAEKISGFGSEIKNAHFLGGRFLNLKYFNLTAP